MALRDGPGKSGDTDLIVCKGGFGKVDQLALILIIIGALNWGLVGFLQFDLVMALFGETDSIISRIVHTIVGLAGVYSIKFLFERREQENTKNGS